MILERQEAVNCEKDEAEIIEEFFSDQLRQLTYDPERDQIRIPVGVTARWYVWATNEKAKTAAVSKKLRQMADEGQLHRISPDTSRTYGRGFIWTGEHADINSPISNDLTARVARKRERCEGRQYGHE